MEFWSLTFAAFGRAGRAWVEARDWSSALFLPKERWPDDHSPEAMSRYAYVNQHGSDQTVVLEARKPWGFFLGERYTLWRCSSPSVECPTHNAPECP